MSLRSFKDPYERQAELEKENLALDDELKECKQQQKNLNENWNATVELKIEEIKRLRGIIEKGIRLAKKSCEHGGRYDSVVEYMLSLEENVKR